MLHNYVNVQGGYNKTLLITGYSKIKENED